MERQFPQSEDWLRQQVADGREAASRYNTSPWLSEALFYGQGLLAGVLEGKVGEDFQSVNFSATTNINGWARDIFQNLSRLNLQMLESHDNQRVALQLKDTKGTIFINAARELRRRRDYSVIPQILSVLSANRDRISKLTFDVMSTDLFTLYTMACQEDRFLIGTRDGGQWKRVTLPPLESASERMMRVYNLTMNYITHLGFIGRQEAMLVPDNPISIAENEQVRLPLPARSMEELLEDAYFRQRYILPIEGAEVRFRRAGDLQRMIVMNTRNRIFANFLTEQGEALVTIDTTTADWTSPDIYSPTQLEESRWATILAEVYHDIVTADEIPTTRFRRIRRTREDVPPPTSPEDPLNEPEVIYIPRRVRVGEEEAPRLPYLGPPRPIRPHRVSGHIRRANMTQEQLLNIMDLERELGIEIRRFIPDDHTFVRPHISPREAQQGFRNLPIFIKRRIETQLAQDLQRQIRIS